MQQSDASLCFEATLSYARSAMPKRRHCRPFHILIAPRSRIISGAQPTRRTDHPTLHRFATLHSRTSLHHVLSRKPSKCISSKGRLQPDNLQKRSKPSTPLNTNRSLGFMKVCDNRPHDRFGLKKHTYQKKTGNNKRCCRSISN